MSGPVTAAVAGLSGAECCWVLSWLAAGADSGLEGQDISDGIAALRKWQDRHPDLAQRPRFWAEEPRAAGGSGG